MPTPAGPSRAGMTARMLLSNARAAFTGSDAGKQPSQAPTPRRSRLTTGAVSLLLWAVWIVLSTVLMWLFTYFMRKYINGSVYPEGTPQDDDPFPHENMKYIGPAIYTQQIMVAMLLIGGWFATLLAIVSLFTNSGRSRAVTALVLLVLSPLVLGFCFVVFSAL